MQQLVGVAPPFEPVWGDEDGLWAADAGRIGHERSQSQTGAAQQRLRSPGHLVPLRLKHVRPGSSCSHLHHVNEAAAAAVQLTSCSDSPGKSTCKRRTGGTGSICDQNRETSQTLNATKLEIWQCSWEQKVRPFSFLLFFTEQKCYISSRNSSRSKLLPQNNKFKLDQNVIHQSGGEENRPTKVSVQAEHLSTRTPQWGVGSLIINKLVQSSQFMG